MTSLVLGAILLVGVVLAVQFVRPGRRSLFGPSTTRVPVDDFVVGDLPMICTRTGVPADGLVGIESHESVFQLWWLLLLFLGPLGIAAIVLAYVLSPRPARVSGTLPMTHQALADQNRLVTVGNWAWAIPVVAFVAGAALLLAPSVPGFSVDILGVGLLFAGLVGGFVALVVVSVLISRSTVRVRLDGSGRWVELSNVHSSFATAVNRQTRERHRAARARREHFET